MDGIAAAIGRYREVRLSLHRRRSGAGVIATALLSLAMACFTGLMAQVVIPLPWTPVPITGQTLAVLLAAMALGRRGALSQLLYLAIGFAGVPWFAGAAGGQAVMAGPTVGYLAGFVVAAYLAGAILDRYRGARTFFPLVIIMCAANVVIILGMGTLYLYFWLVAVKGAAPGPAALLYMGAIPFLPGAAVKTLLAAFIGTAILPKEPVRF